jgi:hypothetical protein
VSSGGPCYVEVVHPGGAEVTAELEVGGITTAVLEVRLARLLRGGRRPDGDQSHLRG